MDDERLDDCARCDPEGGCALEALLEEVDRTMTPEYLDRLLTEILGYDY